MFAVFDSEIMAYRVVLPRFRDPFIEGTATINTWSAPDPTGRRKRRSAWIPRGLYAVLQGRRTLLRLLERIRVLSPNSGRARAADWLQRRLMNDRHRRVMLDSDGARRDFVTPDIALGPPVAFRRGDVLFCSGYGWNDGNICEIGALRTGKGVRLAIVCYDIIPLQSPHFFKPRDVDDMRHYWDAAFANAEQVVVNSKAVAADVRRYCAEHAIAPPKLAVRPLGADPAEMRSASGLMLPAGLEEGRYALFVSTIEPRKGHQLLHRVWKALLAEGDPRLQGFKLVFVGRPGWMMEAFERTLKEDSGPGGSLVVLAGVSDALLDLLYRRAAFCLYPSLYEGYGLPVVEAFARGKAVLASSAGALPELAADFSPCLEAEDEAAWRIALKAWIVDPAARAPYEQAIAERFRHPAWAEAAAGVFAAVLEPGPEEPAP